MARELGFLNLNPSDRNRHLWIDGRNAMVVAVQLALLDRQDGNRMKLGYSLLLECYPSDSSWLAWCLRLDS